MKIEVKSHAFSYAEATMEPGEVLLANPGSMVLMRGQLDVGSSISEALNPFKSMMRRAASREVVMAKYTAKGPALLGVAPELPGDMVALDLARTGPLRIEAGALLAYEQKAKIGTRMSGIGKSMMGNSMVNVLASGEGHIVLAALGALKTYTLRAGEDMIVDSGHIVAWSEGMKMKIGPLKGLVQANLTGEGLVGQFQGPGTVLVQTRARQSKKK